MERKENEKKREIYVIFSKYDMAQFLKSWPDCKKYIKGKKIVYTFDMDTHRFKSQSFENEDIGNLSAVVSLYERAKRIVKF